MLGLEVVVAVGIAIIVAALVAPRLRIPVALAQVLVGVLLGFIPALREVQLPSEAVLLLFLPALLFWESLTTSRREMRRFIRVILLNGTLLVVVTAFAVAAVAAALGLPWAVALVLGAALAPTDATAVGSLAGSLPRRQRTVLRAESLINDGTALVLYALAVGVAAGTEEVSPLSITGTLALSYLGGIAIGVAFGLLGTWTHRIRSALVSNVGFLVTPFAAFLAAELIHASGVLAVVVTGLVMSQRAPSVGGPEARDTGISFWAVTTYILNGSLFVLIGLELQTVVRALPTADLGFGLLLGVAIWATLIVARGAFTLVTTTLIRTLDRRPYQRTLRASPRSLVVSTFAGFRGAVSLAAALAIPLTTAAGEDFPFRDTAIFVAAVVILLTLAVQGPIMPLLIRWARFTPDDVEAERRTASRTASEAALAELPKLAASLEIDDAIRDKVGTEMQRHLHTLEVGADGEEDPESARRMEQYTRLRLAALEVKRDTLVRLRDEREIDDTVLRGLQSQLDLEELRLTGREGVE